MPACVSARVSACVSARAQTDCAVLAGDRKETVSPSVHVCPRSTPGSAAVATVRQAGSAVRQVGLTPWQLTEPLDTMVPVFCLKDSWKLIHSESFQVTVV